MCCPTCNKEITDPAGAAGPFCSSRCRLIDLGGWLDGRYQLPGLEPAPPQEE